MNKNILILGFIAIFATAIAVDCPEDDEGNTAIYYPHETECGLFYECDHGKAQILHCPNGLYWDKNLNVCNRNVDCGNLSTSSASPTDPTEPTQPTEPTEPESVV